MQQRALLVDFCQRHRNLRPRMAEFQLALLDDPYFNALQVKYGYALTCHKAQGGEWDTVVVDFGDSRGKRNEEFFRWTYTALTRAKRRLLSINAPKFGGHSGQDLRFEHHRRLCSTFAACGIAIDRLEHLQYCERYYVSRDGARAVVQYWYKGDGRVSRVAAAPGAVSENRLLVETLTAMRTTLDEGGEPSSDVPEFVRTFREQVEAALQGTDIRLVGSQPKQYCLRLAFDTGGRRAEIDFFYDGTPKWTRVLEVGGPGASRGLIEQVREAIGARMMRS